MTAFGRNPYLTQHNPRLGSSPTGRPPCANPVTLPQSTLGLTEPQPARVVACGHAYENHNQQFGYCTVTQPAKCACMLYVAPGEGDTILSSAHDPDAQAVARTPGSNIPLGPGHKLETYEDGTTAIVEDHSAYDERQRAAYYDPSDAGNDHNRYG